MIYEKWDELFTTRQNFTSVQVEALTLQMRSVIQIIKFFTQRAEKTVEKRENASYSFSKNAFHGFLSHVC